MTPDEFKARRKRLGMTQKQIAEALGWSAQHISNLETGHSVIENPTLLNLALLQLELASRSPILKQLRTLTKRSGKKLAATLAKEG